MAELPKAWALAWTEVAVAIGSMGASADGLDMWRSNRDDARATRLAIGRRRAGTTVGCVPLTAPPKGSLDARTAACAVYLQVLASWSVLAAAAELPRTWELACTQDVVAIGSMGASADGLAMRRRKRDNARQRRSRLSMVVADLDLLFIFVCCWLILYSLLLLLPVAPLAVRSLSKRPREAC